MDRLAVEYRGRVDVIAVAWKASYDATASRASALLPSGAVRWGLDEDQSIFGAFGFGYQPNMALVSQGVLVRKWVGAAPMADLRAELDEAVGT